MKITAVRGYPVKVGIRNQFIVTVETDEGVTGVGEGGISGREEAMQGMLAHFSRFLIGEDPARIEHLWQTMYRGAYFEGGKINAATLSAVDIALWDILGKWLGVPVYQLLGGATREHVSVLCHPRRTQRARVRRASARNSPTRAGATCASFPACLVRTGLRETGRHVRAVRVDRVWLSTGSAKFARALGTSVELSIDFHHRLSVAEAAVFCQRVEPLHLQFVEEPIRAESPTPTANYAP